MTKKQKECKTAAQMKNYSKKNAILDFIVLMGYDEALYNDVKTWQEAISRFK